MRKKTGQRIGYVRVSTLDQNAVRQLDGIFVDRTFLDKKSGKDVKREQLDAMMEFVRSGDSIVVHSMDVLLETSTIFGASCTPLPRKACALNLSKRVYRSPVRIHQWPN